MYFRCTPVVGHFKSILAFTTVDLAFTADFVLSMHAALTLTPTKEPISPTRTPNHLYSTAPSRMVARGSRSCMHTATG